MAHVHGFAPRSIDTYPPLVPTGKFGRMFPMLEPLQSSDDALCELGRAMLDTKPASQEGDNTKIQLATRTLDNLSTMTSRLTPQVSVRPSSTHWLCGTSVRRSSISTPSMEPAPPCSHICFNAAPAPSTSRLLNS